MIDDSGLERVVDSDTYVSEFFFAEERSFDDIDAAYPYRRPVGSMRTRSAIRVGAASDTVLMAYAQWRARGLSLPAMQDLFTAFNTEYEGTIGLDSWLDEHAPMIRYERFGTLVGHVLYTGETTRAGPALERIDFDRAYRMIAEAERAGIAREDVDLSAVREPIPYDALRDRIHADSEGEGIAPLDRFAQLYANLAFSLRSSERARSPSR